MSTHTGHFWRSLVVVILGLGLVASLFSAPSVAQDATPVTTDGVEVLVSGLTNPRGFTWGDDGTLYLALAGTGGDDQVTIDGTPYPFMVGGTSSIVTVADGCTTPYAEGLGSLYWTEAGWTWGIMDVVLMDGQLYVLAGAGTAEAGNGVYRINADGSHELVADLGAWASENPTDFVPPDYDPTGSWFDMEAGDGILWVTEAVGGRLMTVSPEGEITLVADLSAEHMVPTGIALADDGGAYVGFETTVPYPDGASKVIHVAPDGTTTDVWTGLTAVTDIALGPDGTLYAAEMATNNTEEPPYLTPGSGRIVRQTGADTLEEVVTDIPYPVMIGFDADGALVIAYPAFGENIGEGLGALVAVDLDGSLPVSLADMATLPDSCAA
ncbi:MAG: ScyD/ScyE family protein [Chloroflexota bacterium]|nr:ScyD/ScyE family protein [Chloroflexota bacterium]